MIIDLFELKTERCCQVCRLESPGRTAVGQLFPGRKDDRADSPTGSNHTTCELAKGRPVLRMDGTEEGVVKQEVVRLIVVEGEGIFGNEPAPERTKPTPTNGSSSAA